MALNRRSVEEDPVENWKLRSVIVCIGRNCNLKAATTTRTTTTIATTTTTSTTTKTTKNTKTTKTAVTTATTTTSTTTTDGSRVWWI